MHGILMLHDDQVVIQCELPTAGGGSRDNAVYLPIVQSLSVLVLQQCWPHLLYIAAGGRRTNISTGCNSHRVGGAYAAGPAHPTTSTSTTRRLILFQFHTWPLENLKIFNSSLYFLLASGYWFSAPTI